MRPGLFLFFAWRQRPPANLSAHQYLYDDDYYAEYEYEGVILQIACLEPAPYGAVKTHYGGQGIYDAVHDVYVELVGEPRHEPCEPPGEVDAPVYDPEVEGEAPRGEPLCRVYEKEIVY